MWDPARIRARLATARAADQDFEYFGAGTHQYELGSALPEDRIAAVEAEHCMTLPKSYRDFLLTVGDGGAGPDYGLYRFDGQDMPYLEREERFAPGHLAAPFPHTEPWNPNDPWTPDARDDEQYFDLCWTTGSLILAHVGCGHFHRLVVTGPARGQIWADYRAADGGLEPESADYGVWYRDWLDRLPS